MQQFMIFCPHLPRFTNSLFWSAILIGSVGKVHFLHEQVLHEIVWFKLVVPKMSIVFHQIWSSNLILHPCQFNINYHLDLYQHSGDSPQSAGIFLLFQHFAGHSVHINENKNNKNQINKNKNKQGIVFFDNKFFKQKQKSSFKSVQLRFVFSRRTIRLTFS